MNNLIGAIIMKICHLNILEISDCIGYDDIKDTAQNGKVVILCTASIYHEGVFYEGCDKD